MTDAIRLAAPAKVNLYLRILAREADGWHGLETLYARLSLADDITVQRRTEPGVTLEVEGADTGPADQNLATRAATLVLAATGGRSGVHIRLDKRIPVGAGLGGGSSDAAATLVACNQLAGNAIPRHELLQLAARLGADVPFFLSGFPLALAWGHGERMLGLPALPPAPALLLIPPTPVATPEAYRWLAEARQGMGRRGALALEPASLANWSDLARMAGNDFESPVFGRHPAIRQAFEALAGTHPMLCRMSGSGSALFAVYRTPRDLADARLQLGRRWGRLEEVRIG